MSLDPVLAEKYKNDPWFKAHPVAWLIVNDGMQQISSKKPTNFNMQCLLSNMCAYGDKKWQYEPGNADSGENTLKGSHVITDCSTLAHMFCDIANHLGFTTKAKQIKKDGYRIVTKPGIMSFNGKSGDQSLENRWCFGNHWIAECENTCYDPTFNFKGFSFNEVGKIYLGWYAKEEKKKDCFTGTYWKKEPNVLAAKDIYIRLTPNFAYTFKSTDKAGKEIG
mgnify:CR=1 FL=1